MITAILLAATCSCSRPVSLKVELCTPENVVKALELSEQFLPPSERCDNCLYFSSSGTLITGSSGSSLSKDPDESATSRSAGPKRIEAKKLLDEADALDRKAADAAFVRKILKACQP